MSLDVQVLIIPLWISYFKSIVILISMTGFLLTKALACFLQATLFIVKAHLLFSLFISYLLITLYVLGSVYLMWVAGESRGRK